MTGIEIFNCEQNSPAWHLARKGIATASAFGDVLAKGEGKTRRTYLLKLAGEIITGQPMECIVSRDMERGHAMEAEARDLYTLKTDAQLAQVGFVRNGRVGCSPDSLIGDDGGLEIKTKFPHLLIDVILKDEFPAEHKAQVQGALWVTGRQWWDVAIYWPGLPLFVKRAHRDEAYIQQMATEVERFNADLDGVVSELRRRELAEALPNSFASLAAVSAPIAETIVPVAAVDALDERELLADIQRAFDQCVDWTSFGKKQQELMAPNKKRVSPATWKKAVKLAMACVMRLAEEPGGVAVAAE